jgi:hypothetical protein
MNSGPLNGVLDSEISNELPLAVAGVSSQSRRPRQEGAAVGSPRESAGHCHEKSIVIPSRASWLDRSCGYPVAGTSSVVAGPESQMENSMSTAITDESVQR